MKMVALMCVEQFVEEARNLLKNINVNAYSESEMKGIKNAETDESDNWFAQKHLANNSHLLFTIVSEDEATKIFSAVKEINNKDRSIIRAFQLNIEKAEL
jgi:nitrogen regulatory protein PII-like uncharacterized protein